MAEARFTPLRFDSAELPVADQYRTFASAMVNFDMHCHADGPFAARASVWRIGSLVLTQVSADPVRYDRPASRVRADRVDHIYLNYHFSGRVRADCGSGAISCGAGSLLAIDMRRPCRLDVGRIEEISVGIPRRLILPRLDPLNPHGLCARGGLTLLLGQTLKAICASLDHLDPAHAATVERLIVDLAVDALREAASAAEAVSTQQEELAGRVRAYMDAHLGEPLDVGAVCRGVGVSRSSLYRAFGNSGGVLRQLQQRRLRRMRALLEDPAESRSIAALANETGFADRSHFARAFKQAYGMTPGELRAAPAAGKASASPLDHEAARIFGNWVDTLD